jgi:hypothetical protein
MARTRKNKLTPHPAPAPHKDVVKSVRMPKSLDEAIVKRCGDLSFSAWACEILQKAVETPEDEACREVEELMLRRGVTLEMLQARAR